MEERDTFAKGRPIATRGVHAYDSSHAVLLSARQWLAAALVVLGVVCTVPSIWSRVEKLEWERDYRVPYDLGNDYWFYDRWTRLAASRCDTVFIGDSVVWGQYVARNQTLTHCLNEIAGEERFANLGLDGAHPAALEGLIAHYAGGLQGKTVVLNCNPLWMSSPQRDLRERKEFQFNHPELTSQFFPWIACNKADISTRLGNVVDRNIPLNGWTRHLQQAYFDRSTIPEWTLDHPAENPVRAFARPLPPSDNKLRHRPVSWTAQKIEPQDFPWIELNSSLQWGSFRRAVATLQGRGNRVIVLLGPFNEHLLTDESRAAYQILKNRIESELRGAGIQCIAPDALPSEMYADASHPLAPGYALLARQIFPVVIETRK